MSLTQRVERSERVVRGRKGISSGNGMRVKWGGSRRRDM